MNKLFVAVFFVAMVGLGMSSCGGDDSPAGKTTTQNGGNEGGGNGGGGNEGGGDEGGGGQQGGTPMTKTEQTDLLESTARELIAMAPASDFEEFTTMFKEARNISAKNVDNWAQNIFEKTKQSLGGETLDYSYVGEYYESYTYSRQFKAAYEVANYKGHFEVQNGEWKLVQENVDDLKFTFKDSKNATWVLRAAATGPYKKVHMFDLREHNYYYSYTNNKDVYKYYTDYTQCIIAIPKTLTVTLTKNGTEMVSTTVNATLSDIANEEFNISRNDISANVAISVKDYKIDVSQVTYKHNASANVNVKVTKGSKQMLTASVSGELSGLPSVNVSAFSENFDSNAWEFADAGAVVKIDILGKVQLQGTVKKIHTLVDKLEAARKNRESETAFKSYVKDANEYFDLGLFFNNKSVKQSTIYLEPFEQTGYRYAYDNGNWSYQPYKYWKSDLVIKFGDESTYSTMASYFSKDNFRSVYGDIDALIDSYSKLIEK
ncbi:MAG: hypothetical protein J5954_06935 [Prevotella sp.]|nr:hypothetical protein [Prevotella sp.]